MVVDRAEQIFGSLYVNNDGDITEEESVKGCMEDEEMVKLVSDTCAEAPLVKDISVCITPTGMVTLETLNDSRSGSILNSSVNAVKTLNERGLKYNILWLLEVAEQFYTQFSSFTLLQVKVAEGDDE